MDKDKLFQATKLAGQCGFGRAHGVSVYAVCQRFKELHPNFHLDIEGKEMNEILWEIQLAEKDIPSLTQIADEFQTTRKIVTDKIFSHSGIYSLLDR